MKNLTQAEIERRIYECMIIIHECKKTFYAKIFCDASEIVSKCFKVREPLKVEAIAHAVARRYTESHGQPTL